MQSSREWGGILLFLCGFFLVVHGDGTIRSLTLMREVARLVRDGGRERIRVMMWRLLALSNISPSVSFADTLRQREPISLLGISE